jgi:nucleotide-binding universal stress UspA family protein
MRVLIATDGSKEATAAIRVAGRLLTSIDREIDVLYVAPQLVVPKSGKVEAELYSERLAADTKRILRRARQTLLEEGMDARTKCRSGSPAPVVLEESGDYDLTVVGAKGRDVRSDLGLGPVSSRVVEHATGCVLVSREPRGEKGVRILVPVDGSDGSRQALDALSSFFELASADITLMHVIETPWLRAGLDEELLGNTDPASASTDTEVQLSYQLKREADQLVSEARSKILAFHAGVTTSIREGNPANEILSEADQGEYDLVVVGANEANDLKHSILGSVSSKVAWNAPCSVLVVRIPE